MPLRTRRLDASRTSTAPIGQIDYINLGVGQPRGYLSSPIKVMADIGTGLDTIAIDENHGRPPYQVGGPFFLRRVQTPVYTNGAGRFLSKSGQPPHGASTRPPDVPGSDWRIEYTGSFAAHWTVWGSPPLPGESIRKDTDYDSFSNRNDMQDLGNRAYVKLRPKVEKASLLQSVIEAREIPRTLATTAKDLSTLWRSVGGSDIPSSLRTQAGKWHRVKGFDPDAWKAAPKRASESFLNLQFGWKPLLRDLDALCKVVLNFKTYVERAEARNNVWLKRQFIENDIRSESVVTNITGGNQNYCLPAMDTTAWVVPGSGAFRVVRQQLTRVWYEGLFKYYRPEFDKGLESGYPALRQCQQALTLLGGNINPTTLYKVTPWTWLTDWFVNVGDAVQRFEDLATDSVASKYFYLMRETIDRYVLRASWRMYDGQSPTPSWSREVVVKRRVGSNSPFNFSLMPSELSGMQLTILAALGMSR